MCAFLDSCWWTAGLASIVQFVRFVHWLYRRVRNDELAHVIVQDMATNHLPHIYDRLEQLCDEEGIKRSIAAHAMSRFEPPLGLKHKNSVGFVHRHPGRSKSTLFSSA